MAKSQFECWATLKFGDLMVKQLGSGAENETRCLFAGLNKQVFLFTKEAGSDEATLHILKAKDGATTGAKEAAATDVMLNSVAPFFW